MGRVLIGALIVYLLLYLPLFALLTYIGVPPIYRMLASALLGMTVGGVSVVVAEKRGWL